MEEKKPFWKSKTVWGSAIAIIAGILDMFGVHISEQLQADAAELVLDGLELGGAGVALYGRFVADKKLV